MMGKPWKPKANRDSRSFCPVWLCSRLSKVAKGIGASSISSRVACIEASAASSMGSPDKAAALRNDVLRHIKDSRRDTVVKHPLHPCANLLEYGFQKLCSFLQYFDCIVEKKLSLITDFALILEFPSLFCYYLPNRVARGNVCREPG